MGARPSGTVTFLFTDVEGSTALWEREPDAMRAALALHDEILKPAVERHHGVVFATGGDGLAAAFGRADAAVSAAIDMQRGLATAPWPTGATLRVRMGLHTGEAEERSDDYFGPAVNKAARVMAAGNGSQILVSGATRDVLGQEVDPSSRLIDLGEHELRDVLEPVRLFRVEDPSFVSDPRPPRTGAARAGNLPLPVGVLLGRDDDVEAIVADLTTARVVTLAGVGGVGKTRLAIEVGRRLQPRFSDGVWFAALDTVDQPDAMLRLLLSQFGIDSHGAPDHGALVDGLRHRRALLVLDNCEHLLDAAAEVATAIAGHCPHMQVLATSREPLDVDGERTRLVRSLGTDEGGPAAALFCLRADEAGTNIDHTRDAEAIARICRRVDGIPLAIELAAARTRSLRPADIADRLEDMFGLLTGGRRGRAERHRTLRATLGWSYDLLEAPEQELLARLSVFAGAFSLPAAEAVGGARVNVLDRLVSRSLVVPLDDGDETRFRLLEPVRQLGAEKLATSGATDAARAAHAAWYFQLIVDLSARWREGDDQGTWPIAAREMANLHQAFDHLIDLGRIDDAQQFAVAAFYPVAMHDDTSPMYDWAPRSIALDPEHVGAFTASAWALAAWGESSQGDLDSSARSLAQAVRAVERGARDNGLITSADTALRAFGGHPDVGEAFLQRRLDDAFESDDRCFQIWTLQRAGRLDEALAIAQQLNNQTMLALIQHSFAVRGGWEEAESYWESAQRSHSPPLRNQAARRLGHLHIQDGRPLDGLVLLRPPVRDWLLRNDARVWGVLFTIAEGLLAAGDIETAAAIAHAAAGRPLIGIGRRDRARLAEALERAGGHVPTWSGDGDDVGSVAELALAAIDELVGDSTIAT